MPYLISCPFDGSVPKSVSLVEHPCENAANNLEIINNQPHGDVKKRFGVCTKQFTYENRDFTIKFIEWVYLCRLLGAEKIHLSFEYLHPDFFKVVDYLRDQGFIEYYQFFNPSGAEDSKRRSWQTRMLETNILTDCFYRNMNLYDYIVVIDTDEVIVPVNDADYTWEDILARVDDRIYIDGYIADNVFFPETGSPKYSEIPEYMYMLQHTLRARKFSSYGQFVKSIFGTNRVVYVHNHRPHQCLNQNMRCMLKQLPRSVGRNNHYRFDEDSGGVDLNSTGNDTKIWKYKDQLIKAVQKTLKETGFDPKVEESY
jgi:hypothetical protein